MRNVGTLKNYRFRSELVKMWSVQTARDTAWTNAELLWELQDLPSLSEALMTVLDRLSGLASRGLLTAV